MGKSLNWGEVDKAVSENQNRISGGFRFQVNDGETVVAKFLIPDDGSEPFIYKRHFVKGKGYPVCAEDAVAEGKHDGCVVCYAAKEQGKGGPVSLQQRVFAFSIFDSRKQHVFKEPVKGPTMDKPSRFHPCPDDATCRFCRKGDEPKVNGVRHWTLSGKVAQQLKLWEKDVLGQTCAVCEAGKIKVTGYMCPNCEEPLEVDDPDTEVKCFECSKLSQKKGGAKNVMVEPQEVLTCKRGCENPRRVGLADVWVMITRSGSTQDTNYNFTKYQGDEPVEIPDDVKPVDFQRSGAFKPIPANEQAVLVGMENPYRGKKRSRVADDEDVTDSDDDDDSDDDNDSPSIFGNKKR